VKTSAEPPRLVVNEHGNTAWLSELRAGTSQNPAGYSPGQAGRSHVERGPRSTGRARLALLVVAVIAIGAIGSALYLRAGSSSRSGAGQSPGTLSVGDLQRSARALHAPVFWAGAIRGMEYELHRAPFGRVAVSYLPEGSRVAHPVPSVKVTTYPLTGAFAATVARTRSPSANQVKLPGGAIAVWYTGHPNVYVAYPGWPFQVTLVASSQATAHRLAASGRLQSVPGTPTPPQPSVAIVSLRQLKQLADSLSQPIYWAGPQTGVTYELTRMPDGRIYLRYLPAGTRIRSALPALTIATLPLRDAFAITQATAKGKHARTTVLPGGGIATVAPRERQAYLAYRGLDYQAEVLAPLPAAAWRLASAGRIVAVH